MQTPNLVYPAPYADERGDDGAVLVMSPAMSGSLGYKTNSDW